MGVRVNVHLAGSTFCEGQTFLAGLVRSNAREQFVLVRDPGNPYDHNAIKVEGRAVNYGRYGYVKKDENAGVAACMDRNGQARVIDYRLYGGADGKNYGVELTVELVEEQEEEKSGRTLSAAEKDEVFELVRQGLAAKLAGSYDEAYALYEQAFRIWPDEQTLISILKLNYILHRYSRAARNGFALFQVKYEATHDFSFSVNEKLLRYLGYCLAKINIYLFDLVPTSDINDMDLFNGRNYLVAYAMHRCNIDPFYAEYAEAVMDGRASPYDDRLSESLYPVPLGPVPLSVRKAVQRECDGMAIRIAQTFLHYVFVEKDEEFLSVYEEILRHP